MTLDSCKKLAGIKAAEFVESGMVVGLGTGSTAKHFIDRLIERIKDGLKIQAVATSRQSLYQAEEGGIPILNINQIPSIDLTVDGADQVDCHKRLIKGAGGALVREKIVASMSTEMVVIIDETKLVTSLGNGKLPLEIIPFATHATEHRITGIGYTGSWRLKEDRTFFVTENHNFIFDVDFPGAINEPEKHHEVLRAIPGVVDTGFFFDLAGRIVVGFKDDQVTIHS